MRGMRSQPEIFEFNQIANYLQRRHWPHVWNWRSPGAPFRVFRGRPWSTHLPINFWVRRCWCTVVCPAKYLRIIMAGSRWNPGHDIVPPPPPPPHHSSLPLPPSPALPHEDHSWQKQRFEVTEGNTLFFECVPLESQMEAEEHGACLNLCGDLIPKLGRLAIWKVNGWFNI